MESLMYKLKDTITTTVSSMSSYIPGNPVTREYEIVEHRASGGPGLVWKIYSGYKKSTKEEASIFILDKKVLQKHSKRERDVIIERLRKGVSQLTRLKHPSILTVSHPLEESRESLAFATEPVFASLANLLGSHENMPSPLPPDSVNYQFFDVEIKYGLLLISEGLAFLHNDAKLLHRNICPEIVMVNKRGAWKLTGFEFSCAPHNPHDFPLYFPYICIQNHTEDPILTLPNLDYIAPEYLTEASGVEPKIGLNSDMYSLGALTYTLYNKGKPLLPTGGNLSLFVPSRLKQYEKIPSNTFDCLPEESRHHIKMLMSVDPILRPDAHQFNKLNIFEDVLVRTLQYLDSLFQWDNLQKSQFYKGLPEIMSLMPLRVKLHRVFPAMAKEFINPEMVPFVLPNAMIITEEVSDNDFVQFILPELVPVFQMKEPIQISVILMQKMELILTKCKSNPTSIKEHILPMICRCLEVEVQQIQEQALNTIPTVVHLVDPPSIKNIIVPRIKKLCMSTGQLATRVNCLLCIAKLLESIDKWVVLDDIVPFLPEIPSKEPPVIMAVLGIYKRVLNNSRLGLTKEMMATKIIPYLMPLSIENGLTVQQFNTVMSVIKEMVEKVESEQRIKVEQINSMKAPSLAVVSYQNNANKEPANDLFAAQSVHQNSETKPDLTKLTNLSLEEKERLAIQKEMNAQFQKQTPLISQPIKPVNPKPIENSKPKDLTSTLINSNLNNFSFASSTQSQRPTTASMNNVSPVMQPMTNAFQMTAPMMSSPLNNQFQTQTQRPQITNAYQMPYNQNPNPYATSFGSTQPLSPMKQQNQVQPQFRKPVDLSAFDALSVPGLSQSSSKSPPMKSMQQTGHSSMMMNTSLLSQNGKSSSSSLNQLSKSDFDDLLS